MANFGSLYARTFFQPAKTFAELVDDDRALRWGALAVAVTGGVYSAVYFFLAHNGGRPTVFTPWLAIPAEDYYRYNQWMHLPSIFLAWVAAAGFTQIAARAVGGKGSFEQTLGVLGFGLSVSSWWTGLHDLITSCLGFFGVLDQRAYEDAMSAPTLARTLLWILMAGYLATFVILFTKGVRAAHRVPVARAAAAGTLGFVVYQLVFVLFNR